MQGKMVQLTSAVILCLALFGQSVMAKPGYAAGYDVDYYVSVSSAFIHIFFIFFGFFIKFEEKKESDFCFPNGSGLLCGLAHFEFIVSCD